MVDYLVYGNVNSSDYGVFISGGGIFNKPARRVEKFTIPGRNGDLTIDEGSYNNVTVTYNAFIARGFENRFNDFVAALLAQTGYQKLQDTFDGEHFRMGLFSKELSPNAGAFNRSGRFTLKFDCMPQRFLVSGDEWVNINSTLVLNNPTHFMSIPVIRVAGVGIFSVNAQDVPAGVTYWWSITVTNPTSGSQPAYIDIDSDMEECYYIKNAGEWNQQYEYWNNIVDIEKNRNTAEAFPVLNTGRTRFDVGQGFTTLKIKPRWWEL